MFCGISTRMSEEKLFESEMRGVDEDEPEEGEIQDDDGSLEDVSSDEDASPTTNKNSESSFYDNKYIHSHVTSSNYIPHSSLPHNSRGVSKTCERKTRRFSATTEENQQRLSVTKYKEESMKPSEMYHVRLSPVGDDRRRDRDDRFVDMLHHYKSVRPKPSAKEEDIVQEKENRHDCRKDLKIKRKCRRKRRHSVLQNPESSQSFSSDSKTESELGSKKVCSAETKKKKESLTKLEIKSKVSHSKKKSVAPKRTKHRCSKKRDSKKLLSKKIPSVFEKTLSGDNGEGNSLLKRLQTMMTVSVPLRKENIEIEKKKEAHSVQNEDEHLTCSVIPTTEVPSSGNDNTEVCIILDSPEKAESLKKDSKNTSTESPEIEIVPLTEKPEPLVITLDDSDTDPPLPAQVTPTENLEATEKDVKEDSVEDSSTGRTDDDDEDLIQLRNLALQSNRRKEASKPRVEDDEVMQLRLEALKSAVLKKCQERKQRGVTLKSRKASTINDSPFPSFADQSNVSVSNLDEETPKQSSGTASVEEIEPDETTTLVDMDLSNTDDESSVPNDIITEPASSDIPLPDEPIGTHILDNKNYNSDISYGSKPLCKASSDEIYEQNQEVSAWKPPVMSYGCPELPKFDIESCRVSGIYNNNMQVPAHHSVGYPNSQLQYPSPFPQPPYSDVFQNDVSGLPNANLDGVPLDAVSGSCDSSISATIPNSFVSSNLNSGYMMSDSYISSEVEPQNVNTNSFIPRIESPNRKLDTIVSTLRPEPEIVATGTMSSIGELEPSAVSSRQSWIRTVKYSNLEDLHGNSHVPTNKSANEPMDENENSKESVPPISSDILDTNTELRQNKSDSNVEGSPNESENIDMSNMIVLDEIGLCSSPETKTDEVFSDAVALKPDVASASETRNRRSGSLDEDEEILRAKVLTTLMRKTRPSESVRSTPESIENVLSPFTEVLLEDQEATNNSKIVTPSVGDIIQETSISGKKNSSSIYQAKKSTKIASKHMTKKLSNSSNVSGSNKGTVIGGKCWKSSVKKAYISAATKQFLTKVNRNISTVTSRKQTNDVLGMNVEIGHPSSRLVYGPRVTKSTTLQVTVPADDARMTRTVAESTVNSAGTVQSAQRFVIRLGDDSDSPDEEEKGQKTVQNSKRRCVVKNLSSPIKAPVLTVSTSTSPIVPYKHHADNSEGLKGSHKNPHTKISLDFEKSVDIFLKQARKSQEAEIKSLTPNKGPGIKVSTTESSATPSAVRHLPSSQQEEYRRLKQQIAELEEQKKLNQQLLQQKKKKNPVTSTKSISLALSPSRTPVVASNVKSPLKIVVTNLSTGKDSPKGNKSYFGGDTRKIFRTAKAANAEENIPKKFQQHFSNVKWCKDVKVVDRSVNPTQKITTVNKNISRTVQSAGLLKKSKMESEVQMAVPTLAAIDQKSKENRGLTVETGNEVASAVGKQVLKMPKNTSLQSMECKAQEVERLSSVKSDGLSKLGISNEASLEDKQAKLSEVELQLLTKRYEVLDHLTDMTALLRQVELERTTEDECLAEVRHLRSELRRAEERHTRQKQLLTKMRNNVSESYQRVAKGRKECITLSKTCLSLGIHVKGRLYKVPAGGAELMNRKLQQVYAQTQRMSKKRDENEENEENATGSDVSEFINLQVSVQDNAISKTVDIANLNTSLPSSMCVFSKSEDNVDVERTDNSVVASTSTSVSNSECVTSDKTADSELLNQSVSSTEISAPSSVNMESERNVCETHESNSVSVSNEGPTLPDSGSLDTEKCQDSAFSWSSIKRISTGRSEDYYSEGCELKVLGRTSNSRSTMPQCITEYRSPLEHMHFNSGDGSSWHGSLDPHAILCPYELMGTCQDEECNYQHQNKHSTT
ncbi:serine-rich adhesin for platelets-like [Periplaneta americana]|uniref:serine-rich adhesin for platelets-like n=1 Tax=Periplaneta americana TaxID=6978 RepID=UPI0037E725CE